MQLARQVFGGIWKHRLRSQMVPAIWNLFFGAHPMKPLMAIFCHGQTFPDLLHGNGFVRIICSSASDRRAAIENAFYKIVWIEIKRQILGCLCFGCDVREVSSTLPAMGTVLLSCVI